MAERAAAKREWYDAYSAVCAMVPADAHTPCPNCGTDALRLVFFNGRGNPVGAAWFWCDGCLYGLRLCRALIPAGAEVIPFGPALEERISGMPEFTDIAGGKR